jgi:hypothetical protein
MAPNDPYAMAQREMSVGIRSDGGVASLPSRLPRRRAEYAPPMVAKAMEKGLDLRGNKIGTFSAMSTQNTLKRRGEWTRWGRGMCEGWSLEIGAAFRGSVVRSATTGQPTTWIASINTSALGEYLDRAEAMRRVEEQVENSMGLTLHDWQLYQAAKAKRER